MFGTVSINLLIPILIMSWKFHFLQSCDERWFGKCSKSEKYRNQSTDFIAVLGCKKKI